MTVTDRPATRVWRDALQQLDRLLQLPLAERAPILDDLKQSQPQLHSMIVSMLEAEARADLAGFLETRPSPAPASLHPGAQLGPYRIESQIGVGGMGEVWLASRDDGLYQGHVAIKTLLPHFSGGALRERFLREAQILGSLAHPNIARLLDAGSAPDGSLYLVLEYVRGICIDTWCDEQKLSVEARLRLFLDVCAAVGQAHANLVVHRDIKPPNILVTAEGQVKLLDFGVAKLLEADAGLERSDLTRMTGRVFTPEYAAPEQILGEPITTASDVYSLGVLLHVLLTGARPYGRTNNPVEIEHAVLHTEPARASQSAALNTEATAVARGTTSARLARALAGDLDNILARAMHKSPTERYPSVLAFADDLRRHLEHKPILARPESVAARTRKFMRRHRLGAAASLFVVLAICAGIAGVIWQAQVARTEARKATAIKDFLVGIFERNSTRHPEGAKAQQTTAAELLNQASQEIRTGLTDAPEVRTELLGVMAKLYSNMEMQKDALPLLEDRLASQRKMLGTSHPDVARTLAELALSQLQSSLYEDAERNVLEAQRIFLANGEESTIEYAQTYLILGQLSYRLGRNQDGSIFKYFKAGYDLVAAHHPRNEERVQFLLGLAKAEYARSTPDDADKYYAEAKTLIESGAVDVDPIIVGNFYHSYGEHLTWSSRNEEGVRYLRKAIEQHQRVGGEDHPYANDARRALGIQLAWLGQRAEAEELLRSALAAQIRMRGDADPTLTAPIRYDLGRVLLMRGEYPAAEELLVSAIDAFGASNQPTVTFRMWLGRLHTEQGRFDLAAKELEGIDEGIARHIGKTSWFYAQALNRIGGLYLAQGKLADAEHWFRRTVEEPNVLPGLNPNRAFARVGLLRIAVLRRDPQAAEQARVLLKEIDSAVTHEETPDEKAATHMLLGVALTRAGQQQEAQPHLEKAVAMRERMDAPESPLLAEARLYLAQQQHLAGQRDAARKLVDRAAHSHQLQQVGPQHRALLTQTRETIAR